MPFQKTLLSFGKQSAGGGNRCNSGGVALTSSSWFRHDCTILTLCIALLLSCGSDPEAAKREAYERGQSLFAKGDYAAASIEFRKSIQRDSKFGEGYLELGLTQLKLHDPQAANESLTQALTLLPDNTTAKAQLGELYITSYLADPNKPTGIYNRAKQFADEILEKDPKSFDGLKLRGYIAMADNRLENAIDSLTVANRLRPDDPTVMALLVQTLLAYGTVDAAESMATAFIAGHKTYGPLYDFMYSHYMKHKRTADAENLLRMKVANNPNVSMFVMQLGRHYWSNGKREEAVKLLDQVSSNHDRFPDGQLDVGTFYADVGEWPRAVHEFEEGARGHSKKKLTFQKHLARALISSGKTIEAEHVLNGILAEHPKDKEALTARGSLRVAKGVPAELDLAIQDFKTAIEQETQDVNLLYQLASAYELKANDEGARTHYVAALNLQNNHLPSLQGMAHLALRLQRFQEAREYADRILERSPNDPSARLVRTATLAAVGEYDQARRELTELLRRWPKLKEADIQLGMLDVTQKRTADAEKRFRQHYRPGSEDLRPLKGLVEVYVSRNEFSKGISLIRQEVERQPELAEARQFLAETAVRGGNYLLAVEQYNQLAQIRPLTRKSTLNLGLCYQVSGRPDLAVHHFRNAQQMDPKDPVAPALLGQVFQDTGRLQEAIVSYRDSLRLQSGNASVLNNLAMAIAESGGDLHEAARLAGLASQSDPKTPSFADTLGLIYLKQKEFVSALQIFRSIRDRHPKTVAYRIHLAQALMESGEGKYAREEISAAAQLSPTKQEIAEMQRLLSRLDQ